MSLIKILGDNLILSASFDGGNTYEAIGVASEHTLSVSQGSIEAACKEDGVWNDAIAGNLDWSVSLSGLKAMDLGGKSTFDKFFELQKVRKKIKLRLQHRTFTDINAAEKGTIVYHGSAIIESLEESAAKGSVATFSASFKGAGELQTLSASPVTTCSFSATGGTGKVKMLVADTKRIYDLPANVPLIDGSTKTVIAWDESNKTKAVTVADKATSQIITLT